MMLDYARERARDELKSVRSAVLATTGSTGVQAGEFPCEAVGLDLYMLLPQTSDHLFNLDKDSRVSVLTENWELRGIAHALSAKDECPHFARSEMRASEWHVLVQVKPIQIQILNHAGWGAAETFDLAQNE